MENMMFIIMMSTIIVGATIGMVVFIKGISADTLPTFDGNFSKIDIPNGEKSITLRINYPTNTNNCVTLQRAKNTNVNTFVVSRCGNSYYENLTTLLIQAGYNVTGTT